MPYRFPKKKNIWNVYITPFKFKYKSEKLILLHVHDKMTSYIIMSTCKNIMTTCQMLSGQVDDSDGDKRDIPLQSRHNDLTSRYK